uniref:Uncharacterized protein n=1 Tax=Nelumbo nucifera TaxID=4432 RepID=A0A822ZJG9_NELNU|nr:TPA_asm: hypothetical protein HUJ06_001815 [Nelumbo nucifera]
MREVVKHILDQVVRKTLYTAQDRSLFETRFCKKELLQVIEYLPVFSFLDDPTNPSYALLLQLREFLVEKALNQLPREEESTENGQGQEKFNNGDFSIPNRIKKCRTYLIYRFVGTEVGTELLSGTKKVNPGEHIVNSGFYLQRKVIIVRWVFMSFYAPTDSELMLGIGLSQIKSSDTRLSHFKVWTKLSLESK